LFGFGRGLSGCFPVPVLGVLVMNPLDFFCFCYTDGADFLYGEKSICLKRINFISLSS